MSSQSLIPDGVRRVLTEGFRLADIAEPLASFDEAAEEDRAMDTDPAETG